MQDDSDLIDHIHLRVADFDRGVAFYTAILTALDRERGIRRGRDWLEIGPLYLDQSDSVSPPSRIHLCFTASSRGAVAAFHAEGLAAGGRDNGAPGLRDYHPGYYAAFLLDPDGNNIESKFDERV